MKKQYRSDAFATTHETVYDLHDTGAVDVRTLSKFDKMCLVPVIIKEQLHTLCLPPVSL